MLLDKIILCQLLLTWLGMEKEDLCTELSYSSFELQNGYIDCHAMEIRIFVLIFWVFQFAVSTLMLVNSFVKSSLFHLFFADPFV